MLNTKKSNGNARLPRQAKLIASFAVLYPEDGPAQLATRLQGRLNTTQPVERVVNYYWKTLADLGITKPASEYSHVVPVSQDSAEENNLSLCIR